MDEPAAASTLTASEAAAALGIKRDSLYAYASRGWLRSVPTGRGREHVYLRTDVEGLRARQRRETAASSLQWQVPGPPLLASRVTEISEEDGPVYRGHVAVDLARSDVPYESVAELLWTGRLPAQRPRWHARELGFDAKSFAAALPQGASSYAAGLAALPFMAVADPDRSVGTVEGERTRARGLLMRLAACPALSIDSARVLPAVRSNSVAAAIAAAYGRRPSAAELRALDRALVLSADHELDTATVAVRVAASSGADLYHCVSAGLAAFFGPRLGRVCEQIESLARRTSDADAAAAQVRAWLDHHEHVMPGFDHPKIYPRGDPRVPPLLEVAKQVAPGDRRLGIVLAMIEAMERSSARPTSLAFGVVAVAAALDLPPGAALMILVIGRSAGWIAHALEQRDAGYLIRPHAQFVGRLAR